jgi:signal transduction histidine kinase
VLTWYDKNMVTRRGRIASWWLDRPLRSKGLAVLAPPVLVLVVTVAVSFIAESYQVVDTRNQQIDTLQTVVEVVDAIGLLIGVIGGVTAMVLFVSSVVRRIGEVGANAQRLGVFEPLLPVTPAADEIGQLAEELQEASTLLTQRSVDLVRAHTAAVQAAAAADQLLARVSHELRTPLTAVMGFGHLIDRTQLSEQDAEAVEQILHGGDHMLRIIEEGRTPAHPAQAITLDLEPVGVGPLVREVRALLRPLSARRRLSVVGCEDSTSSVLADYYRFKQVLINLLSNAVKFNRVGGRITVSCEPSEAGRFRLAVADTGDGIAAELMDRVFVPFDRLDAEARGVEGTGIGLSLSKTFVEAMGGTIGVESSVGHGSTFWVELPAAPRGAGPVAEPMT